MTTSDQTTLTLLESLLRVGEDSAAGYVTAASDTTEPELSRIFLRHHDERAKLVAHVRSRLRELRGNADAGPTLPGAVHRTWMNLRAAAAANPTPVLLAEIERGEQLAVDAYRGALDRPEIDPTTRTLLQQQYEIVQAAHDRIRQLRDRSNYARADR